MKLQHGRTHGEYACCVMAHGPMRSIVAYGPYKADTSYCFSAACIGPAAFGVTPEVFSWLAQMGVALCACHSASSASLLGKFVEHNKQWPGHNEGQPHCVMELYIVWTDTIVKCIISFCACHLVATRECPRIYHCANANCHEDSRSWLSPQAWVVSTCYIQPPG